MASQASALKALQPLSNRRCFVTVGATAGFRQLLDEITEPAFLAFLAKSGFESLDVQCGPDHEWLTTKISNLGADENHGVKITAFNLTNDMQGYMLRCRGEKGVRAPGVVISHAGTGTVLEAMRYQVPLIVVPNPTLMDNHQAELARECARQKWAVHGELGQLARAVDLSWDLVVEGRLADLPPYTPPPFPVPESERTKLFDWLVLSCYPEEMARQQHLHDLWETEAAGKRLETTLEDKTCMNVD
ncbi:hypothetical protein OQA88_9756 [Cercophora sp. LCS_1]